jgi:NitT/TauT family transport system substrate-binding protein
MKTVSRAVFVAGAGALMSGAVTPGASFAQTLSKLTISAIPADIGGQAWYARDTGMFRNHGIDAQILGISNGPAIVAAVLGGSADIGFSNVITLANARSRGLPLTIIAPANLHVATAPTAGILAVKKTSPIQTGKDLNGKVLAVIGLNNIGQIGAKAWVDKNGGDSTTVKFLELPFPEMVPALISGRVDCAEFDASSDPTVGQSSDQVRRLGSSFDAIATRFAPSGWFTTTDWIGKHQQLARDFVAALSESAAWANTHHTESAAILSRVTGQTPEQINAVTRVTFTDRISTDLFQPNIDVAVKYGLLKEAFPIAQMITLLPK